MCTGWCLREGLLTASLDVSKHLCYIRLYRSVFHCKFGVAEANLVMQLLDRPIWFHLVSFSQYTNVFCSRRSCLLPARPWRLGGCILTSTWSVPGYLWVSEIHYWITYSPQMLPYPHPTVWSRTYDPRPHLSGTCSRNSPFGVLT